MRKYSTVNFMDVSGKGTAFSPDNKRVMIGDVPVNNPVLPESYDSIKGQDKNIRNGLKTISKKMK